MDRFDYDQRKAYVNRVDCDYYTDAIDYTQVKALEEFEGEPLGGARRAHGDVRVNRQIVGFKKIKFYTMENVGAGKLNMPEQEMHTTAFWLHFPAEFLARLGDFTPTERQSGISGLGNALRTVAALLLMCDPHDLGVALSEEIAGGLVAFEPNLYLYDAYPGGAGQSAPLYRLSDRLVSRCRRADRLVRLRGGLPFLRRTSGRSRRTGEGSGVAHIGDAGRGIGLPATASSTAPAAPRTLRAAGTARSAAPAGAAGSGWASGAGRFPRRCRSRCRAGTA